MTQLTFADLAKREPQLAALLREAKSYRRDSVLGTSAAYDVAYDEIYNALPNCGPWCCG